MTGYRLLYKHKIKCDQCHKKEKTYLDLLPECLGCHTDVHQKALPEDCIKCHSFKGWKDLEIDHEKDAAYKLTGKHVDVKCELCHPRYTVEGRSGDTGRVYQMLKFKPLEYSKCNDCHEDVHKGELKAKQCKSCHVTKSWKEPALDHNDPLVTDYKLSGKHENASCRLCHPEEKKMYLKQGKQVEVLALKLKPLKSDRCIDCHYDVHKGQFKKQECEACHSVKDGWAKYTFRHESKKYRGYKLEGKHKEVVCEKCHERKEIRFSEFKKKKKSLVGTFNPTDSKVCSDCHYDIHEGQFEKRNCDTCHSLKSGWKDFTFRHESPKYSGYKLEGKHKEVECQKCHERSEVIYDEFNKKKRVSAGKYIPVKSEQCSDCHYDVHKGQFVDKKCEVCHSPENAWKDNSFKHESEQYKGYKLQGKHKDVVCEKCHERSNLTYLEFSIEKTAVIGTYKPLKSETCESCHKDEHKGKYKDSKGLQGVMCDNCHSAEKEWKESIYKHNSEGKYKRYNPNGQIKESQCEACHVCGAQVFCISCCFQEMGLFPTN